MNIKNTFKNLFFIMAIILIILPFVTTFNELLTRIVERSFIYIPIRKYFLPYEVELVRTIISFFNIKTDPGTINIFKNGVNLGTYISWNCIGWQSFVILLISLYTGLTGNFTLLSKIQVILFGVIGTFLFNLFRISSILILLYYYGHAPAVIVHDYASVFISIIWLFFFWWFAYKFVLEIKSTVK